MRITVLTSSRADYGIYLPLLLKLKKDPFFDIKIIAFGTHVSNFHGKTITKIKEDGFHVFESIETLILGDSSAAISNAIGNTITRFTSIWERVAGDIDLILALGDRYEMFAAVSSTIPFNIPIAHIHGGETTLGAIDNKFRHAITMMSSLHFTSAETFRAKVVEMTGSPDNVYNVGSLSLDNLIGMDLLNQQDFYKKYNIDISKPTILATFHPETVSPEKNVAYTDALEQAFDSLSHLYQIVITMPNADTQGTVIRNRFLSLASYNKNVFCVESFGTLGYFSCMKHCSVLLGNTSSGIIEAASFGKFVINIGDRQKGRAQSENTIDCIIDKQEIIRAINGLTSFEYTGDNIYYKKEASKNTLEILKKYNNE